MLEYINNKAKYILKRSGKFSTKFYEYDVMWKIFPFAVWKESHPSKHKLSNSAKNSHPAAVMPLPPPLPLGHISSELYKSYKSHPWPAAHIFVFKNKNFRYDIIECRDVNGSLGEYFNKYCDYYGNSDKDKNLKINAHFPYDIMESWPLFKNKIINLVDGFIEK